MLLNSIPISGLNVDSLPILPQDFFPLVNSASLTTYRVSVQSLENFLTSSLVPISSSYSLSSSYATTASYSISSSYALSSSYATTSSYSLLSLSSSYALSSSHAISSSYSLLSLSSSYATTSSYALSSSYDLSSSYALSSSNSITSSYSLSTNNFITFLPSISNPSGPPIITNTPNLQTLVGINLSGYGVPLSAHGVILQSDIVYTVRGTQIGYLYIYDNSIGNCPRILTHYFNFNASAVGGNSSFSNQGFFPLGQLSSNPYIWYSLTVGVSNFDLCLIGYF